MGFTVTFESLEQTLILRQALQKYIISLKIEQEYGDKLYSLRCEYLTEEIDKCVKLYELLSVRELEIERGSR